MDQTLTKTDRELMDNESGSISKKKKCQRKVVEQCKTRSYIVGLTVKKRRNYRKGYVQNQSKIRSKNRIIKGCALERKLHCIMLDSWIRYINSLKQRNTQILDLERSQMKCDRLLDNMNVILQNLEHKTGLYASGRSHRDHEYLRYKG